ncbi:MAG: hypothetical protein LAT68_08520 [Cyclobacteriaceae bacterium]|nr:hypothetical protein [Cyclobacteriaceae bacterium]MCH8516360.1 hypothetical protein [Cyclobacteriaceae bacterium]
MRALSLLPLYFAAIIVMLCSNVNAQSSQYNYYEEFEEPTTYEPSYYLSISSGINNPAGIFGIGLEAAVNTVVSVNGTLGIGSWGGKFGANIRYYFNERLGWAFNAGAAYTTGLSDLELEFDRTFVQGIGSGTRVVTFQLAPVPVINLSMSRYWDLFNNGLGRVYIEFGYSIPLVTQDYYTSSHPLTIDGEGLMQILRPGGIVVAFGVDFGF